MSLSFSKTETDSTLLCILEVGDCNTTTSAKEKNQCSFIFENNYLLFTGVFKVGKPSSSNYQSRRLNQRLTVKIETEVPDETPIEDSPK